MKKVTKKKITKVSNTQTSGTIQTVSITETPKRKELIIAYTSPNWKIQKNGLNITLTSGTGFYSEPQEGLAMIYITIEEK